MSTAPAGAALAPTRHWDSLDALRGIAAFLVVTFHCSQVSSGFAGGGSPFSLATWQLPWTWVKFTPLRLFVSSGPSAVVLFFVLSGFVLSLPMLRAGRLPPYAGFVVKRVFRIYPAFLAAILGSAALYALIRPEPIPALSTWFNTVLWDQPLTFDYVARNLLMTGLQPDMTLDLVMWSLVHELRISLIFPLLFLLTHRWPVAAMLASLAVSLVCTAALAGHEALTIGASLVDTGRFLFLFTAGIVLAARTTAIRRAAVALPRVAAPAAIVVALALMLSPGMSLYAYYNFVWGVGAVLLLVAVIGSAVTDKALSAAPLVWLGRVSYSLYLVHLPLLIGAIHLTYGVVPLAVTMPLVIVASLVCADLMYRHIERPFIRIGRLVAGRLVQPRLPVGAAAGRQS